MSLQTLPPLALKYSAAQLAEIDETIRLVNRHWRRMGPRFDTGWEQVGPTIVAEVLAAQRRIAVRADEFVPAILADTGQTRSIRAVAETNIEALVGVTGAGFQVDESLSTATIRAKQAVEAGQTAQQSLITAGSWLELATTTVLADTARTAEGLGRQTRGVEGYIRMVNGGACGRCVVQAGKWFRRNTQFERHPRCRCTTIPASESIGADWQTNPDEYFHSLDTPQQIKLMGSKANAQAVHDGADVSQLVNAYRKTNGMQFAQVSPIKVRNGLKFTTEGVTRRGLAGQQQTGLRRNGPSQQRLMPESIYKIAATEADKIRLLKLNGWISDAEGLKRGRAIIADQRRIERNARAIARRIERAS